MAKKRKGLPVHGWFIFDKPLGMTSSTAVSIVKRAFNAQKAGHGGTLDPLATGVLPIALGEATKTVDYVLSAEKHYAFTVKFGEATNTDDAEGEVIKTSAKRPSKQNVLDVIPTFLGEIEQTPPLFSAIKIKGKPAYARMRKGEDVTLDSRKITIFKLELTDFSENKATFVVHASKGTYVRAIARDMGEKLGCYGHVTMLRRLKAGKFEICDAITQEKLDSCIKMGQGAQHLLLDMANVLDDIPAYKAEPAEVAQLQQGVKFKRIHLKPSVMKVLDDQQNLVSLVEVKEGGEVQILRNFNI